MCEAGEREGQNMVTVSVGGVKRLDEVEIGRREGEGAD